MDYTMVKGKYKIVYRKLDGSGLCFIPFPRNHAIAVLTYSEVTIIVLKAIRVRLMTRYLIGD